MPKTGHSGRKERVYHGYMIITYDTQLERDRQFSWVLVVVLRVNIYNSHHLQIYIPGVIFPYWVRKICVISNHHYLESTPEYARQ